MNLTVFEAAMLQRASQGEHPNKGTKTGFQRNGRKQTARALVKAKLIEAIPGKPTYALTPAGREALNAWLQASREMDEEDQELCESAVRMGLIDHPIYDRAIHGSIEDAAHGVDRIFWFGRIQPLLLREPQFWMCECGEACDPSSSKWRWSGFSWQHHHPYPVGHVDTMFHIPDTTPEAQ